MKSLYKVLKKKSLSFYHTINEKESKLKLKCVYMCVCICIYQQHTYVFQLCSLRGQSNIGNPGAISAPSTQILFSKHQYPIIKLGLLGEITDFSVGGLGHPPMLENKKLHVTIYSI